MKCWSEGQTFKNLIESNESNIRFHFIIYDMSWCEMSLIGERLLLYWLNVWLFMDDSYGMLHQQQVSY